MMKNLPDLLLRLVLGGFFVAGGILGLQYGSGGTIVTCKSDAVKNCILHHPRAGYLQSANH